MEKFEFRNLLEADNSKAKNGNNGNYDIIDVYFKGELTIKDLPYCDWTIVKDDYIRDTRSGFEEYYIEGGKLFWEDHGFVSRHLGEGEWIKH